jgi:dipeptidyl aminopeptidase/acylaminoacyl peptidase
MNRVFKYVLFIGMIFALQMNECAHGQVSRVAPSDCVTVKYIKGIWTNAKATQIAYLVKSPNLDTNRNDYRLYVKDIADQNPSLGTLLISGIEVSDLSWFDDDRRIALLQEIGGIKSLVIVNTMSGVGAVAFKADKDIESYTIDVSGKTIVYSVVDTPAHDGSQNGPTPEQVARGYRVGSSSTVRSGYQTRSVFVRHQNENGAWSLPQQITIENPFTHGRTTHLEYARHLSLSPDGKRLFLTYITEGVPNEWRRNPYISFVASMHPALEIMVLYDIERGSTTLAFKNIICYSEPMWTRDSRSFFLNTHSPIGSSWESDDIRDNQMSPKDVNLFEVDAESGAVSEVLRHVPPVFDDEGPLFVRADGDVIARTDSTSIVRLRRVKDSWQKVAITNLPAKEGDWFEFLVSDGTRIVGVHETVTVPENLFIYETGRKEIRLLTDINPQLKTAQFAPVRSVQWTTKEGLNVDGLLFMPPDYDHNKRYPLVIQTKVDSGWFSCDSGANHYPSFAPQPIAGAGIIYLTRKLSDNWNYQDDLDKRPKGYPGGINEAVQQMDIWDSAIEMLDRRGMIDPSKVGIIGFSRTGFYVEFDLVHSRMRYAAATAADNVQYSLGEYWLFPSFAQDDERMYGGPPYGSTLTNWQNYSVSFNVDRIHTPLLMEEMGSGTIQQSGDLMSTALAAHYEIFEGLRRLGRPVEMYYYPNEQHALDHPTARLASLERNLDWYRFWLQDYEDPAPSKKEQYERWRSLRRSQEEDRISRYGDRTEVPLLTNQLGQSHSPR